MQPVNERTSLFEWLMSGVLTLFVVLVFFQVTPLESCLNSPSISVEALPEYQKWIDLPSPSTMAKTIEQYRLWSQKGHVRQKAM